MFWNIKQKAAGVVHKFPVGTHVVLSHLDGVPDGARGVVEFVDDIGNIFVEAQDGTKNVVLTVADEGVYFTIINE